jgi:hypothetical protein
MRELVDKGEQAPSLGLLLGIYEYDRVGWMGKAETTSVNFWKAVVQDKDAFVFDLLSTDNVEYARILCFGLILQADIEEPAAAKSKLLNLRIFGRSKIRKVRKALATKPSDGLLNAFRELDRLDGSTRLSGRRRTGRPKIKDNVMELRGTLPEECKRRKRQFFGNSV